MNHLEKNLGNYTEEARGNICDAVKPSWLQPTKARNGDKSFSVEKSSKIYEGFDPLAPRKFAKGVAANYDLAKTEAMVLVGIGEGHVLHQVFKKAQAGFTCIVVEPETYLVKEALSNYDFAKLIKEKRLILATTREEVQASLSYSETVGVVENWYVVINPYTLVLPEVYFEYSDYVGKTLNSIRCNTGTMMGAGAQIAHNDLKNLPYLLQFPGVSELRGLYSGRPAVVISTGPSLERNIHLLLDNKVREKVVVICVAQATRILLAYGITPDYMCTVDFGDVNASHFNGLEDCGVPLVALNRAYAPIFTTWKSPIYVATSIASERQCVSDVWLKKGGLEQGGSVSHFAFGLAVHLGCRQIALMGQDLAYEGNVSHNSLADSSGSVEMKDGMITWKVDDPRSPLYKKDYAMGPQIPVEGYFGDQVLTNSGLASFLQNFALLAELHKDLRLYDCTEGGAMVPGFRPTTLTSFLRRFAKQTFIHARETYRYCDDWREDARAALKLCAADTANLMELIGYCKTGIESSEKLREFIGQKNRKHDKEWLRVLKENETTSLAAQERAKKNPLLESAIYGASREIAGKELYVNGKKIGQDDAALETRIRRNLHILHAAKREAEVLVPLYEEVRGKLQQVLADPEALRGEKIPAANLGDAQGYLDKGNWGLPLLELQRMKISEIALFGCDKAEDIRQRCEAMREEAIECGEHWQEDQAEREKRIRFYLLTTAARKEGQKNKGFLKSYRLLLKAHRLFPHDEKAWYGLAASATMLGRHEEALHFYDLLLEANGENKQVRFERLLCLMNAGEIETGFRELEALMLETTDYDHILYHVSELFYNVSEDKSRAVEILRLYIDKYPNNPEAWKRLWEWTGDNGARQQWKKIGR